MKKITDYKLTTWLKFILFSAFGVFSFFINIPLPAYQINIGAWHWGLWRRSRTCCARI